MRGKLVYRGGIDDHPRGRKGNRAMNYVDRALAELTGGRAVGIPESRPYGCSVKFEKWTAGVFQMGPLEESRFALLA